MDYQRHKMCPQVTTYTEDGVPQYKLDYLSAEYLSISKVTSFQIYTVTHDMTAHPELISNLFYKTVDLWWVICMYNGIIDPVTEIYSGIKLKIPSLDELNPLIQAKATKINTTKVILVA